MLDDPNASASTTSPEDKLAFAVDTMRELSRQTVPHRMVELYRQRISKLMPTDRLVTLSRRDMPAPWYRVTRSSHWNYKLDPWKQTERQPRFDRGLLGELLYGDQPAIIDQIVVAPDDPAAEYFEGQRSLMAIPLFDDGAAMNMVVAMRSRPAGFEHTKLPEQVWMSNLFGQMTQNLVLTADLRDAYEAVDRELKAVAAIQRSLLPAKLPQVPGLSLAAHYQTSRRAGGDYYDFFELPDNKWGILMADVSGHGTPAAVLMAIAHSITRLVCDPPGPPAKLLAAVNERLCRTYTIDGQQFITAIYAVFDPQTRQLVYSSAGHPPARIRRADGTIRALDGARSIPLGIVADEQYTQCAVTLEPGEVLVMYTDGITEARNPAGALFEEARLDAAIAACDGDASAMVRDILAAVETFTAGRPASDDRTLLVARIEKTD